MKRVKSQSPNYIKHQPDPGFMCSHCGKWVPITKRMGTKNRNHCPACLWSAHVDEKPGDRKSHCGGQMEPIGLTFKKVGLDKYGKPRQGEIMLIHRCQRCWALSINRIAADDKEEKIIEIFTSSLDMNTDLKKELIENNIQSLGPNDENMLRKSIYGNKFFQD